MDCYGNLDDLVPINDSSGSQNITNYTIVIENGAFMPITLSRTETILHIVFISQGIPINLIIGLVIILNRRLHNPRNTFWLGIIALNLLTILTALLRLVVVYSSEDGDHINKVSYNDERITCLLYSFLTGKPYTILLFILLLATLDRYVAITYPMFHRKHITVRLIIIIQLSCFFVVLGLMSLPFIFGWVPLRCGFNLTLGKWNMLIRFILVLLCVTVQVKVYYQTCKYLTQNRLLKNEPVQEPNAIAIPMKVMSKNQASSSSAEDNLEQNQQSGSHPVGNNDSGVAPTGNSNSNSTGLRSATFFVHRGKKSVSKLELEASKTLIIGILSLFIVTAPMFVVHFSVFVCRQMQKDCSQLTVAVPFVGQAVFIYAVYGPMIYVIRSREFTLAVRQMLRARINRLSINDNYF